MLSLINFCHLTSFKWLELELTHVFASEKQAILIPRVLCSIPLDLANPVPSTQQGLRLMQHTFKDKQMLKMQFVSLLSVAFVFPSV